MLKVCLVFDCEKFISFKQGNPRWSKFEKLKGRINSLIKSFRYNKKGFDIVYNTLIEENFPAALMIVGSLYKPNRNHKFIEFGYHTLNHIPLTLADDNVVKKEIKNIYNLKSFSPPLWMVEDISNRNRVFKLLEKEEYKSVIYRGLDNGIEHEHHFEVSKPKIREGLKLIHVSNWIEGSYNKEKVEKIIKNIKNNLEKDAIYCITSHDFTYKKNTSLIILINKLKAMEKAGEVKIMTISEATL